MKLGYIVFLLITLKTIHANECHVEFDEEEIRTHKVNCQQSKCQFIIKPKPLNAIKLEFGGVYTNLNLWETFDQDGKQTAIFRSKVSSSYSTSSFVSGINGSFVFKYISPTDCYGNSVYFEYTRVQKDQLQCSPILNVVGTDVTTIYQRSSTDCAYRLVRDPLFENSTEKLYFVTSGGDNKYNGMRVNGNEETLNTNILLKNATTDIRIFVEPNQAYSRPVTIQAVLSNENCSCDTGNYVLSSIGESTTIRSPGYPSFACPYASCSNHVNFKPIEVAAGFLSRVLISIKSAPRENVGLTIRSDKFEFSFDEHTHRNVSASFLLEEDTFSTKYVTPSLLTNTLNGHYEMNISRVLIQEDCDCSTFMSKTYEGKWSGIVYIPSHCKMMFCDWTVQYEPKKRLNITVTNANDDDEIQVWNRHFTEVYTGKQLKYTRSLVLPEKSNTHIMFWRKSKGENGKITLSWDYYQENLCNREFMVSTIAQTFTSLDYPLAYSSLGECPYTLRAPENHTITVYLEEVDVENVHDHLSIYDGLSRHSTLIKHFSGRFKNEKIHSTGNKMLIEFFADIHGDGRGYHMNAFAVPNRNENKEQKENPHSVWLGLVVVLLFTAIPLVVVASIIFLQKQRKLSGNFHSFTNALVRFRSGNGESQSSVNISTT